jgi:hypothetical chaperone protein
MTQRCAIDFGTSNSAIGLVHDVGSFELVQLEPGQRTIPTAVFYNAEDGTRCFGRPAIAAYIDGYDGRLMRSMKSILGSDLIDETTEIGGLAVPYFDVLIGYLRHLKVTAERLHGVHLRQAVLGRPVFFVDGDPVRDAKAQASLERAARIVGFDQIAFQYEPIAAALDYEATVAHEHYVLVADIGGGTSDFSVVRVGPDRRLRRDRREDVLANYGVHIAGTDFDHGADLTAIMPHLGYGSATRDGKIVPSSIYHDLSTWHLINTVYAINRVIELRQSRWLYAEEPLHDRLLRVVEQKLGHHLIGAAEEAKIALSSSSSASIDLTAVAEALVATLSQKQLHRAIGAQVERVAQGARTAIMMAGLKPDDIGALYFTGGSTGLGFLVDAIAQPFTRAQRVMGDRFASVASGLARFASIH